MNHFSIDEKVKFREGFDNSEECKKRHSLKSIRRRDTTPITSMIDKIFHRGFKIGKLNKKRENLVTMSFFYNWCYIFVIHGISEIVE